MKPGPQRLIMNLNNKNKFYLHRVNQQSNGLNVNRVYQNVLLTKLHKLNYKK